MKQKKVRDIIRMVAKERGVSERMIVRKMELALADGIASAYRTGNQEKIAMWESIPCKGEIPTAVEFIAWASNSIGKMR